MNSNHFISLFICFVIISGFLLRKKKRLHASMMSLAFCMDLSLLLWIEWTRHAVEKSLALGNSPVPGWFLIFHILISLVVGVLYFVQFYLGFQLYHGRENFRKYHKKIGMTFIVFRVINFLTSLRL